MTGQKIRSRRGDTAAVQKIFFRVIPAIRHPKLNLLLEILPSQPPPTVEKKVVVKGENKRQTPTQIFRQTSCCCCYRPFSLLADLNNNWREMFCIFRRPDAAAAAAARVFFDSLNHQRGLRPTPRRRRLPIPQNRLWCTQKNAFG